MINFFCDNTDKSWEYYGKNDPYFGVLTDDKFRSGNMTEEDKKQFFEEGENNIKNVMETLEKSFPGFGRKTAVDFGCGVGRLVIPLSSRYEKVIGVDISSSMQEETKKNCEQRGVKNIELVTFVDEIKEDVDLIHTHIVLQHIPPKRGEEIINAMCKKLADNGVGAIHFPIASNLSLSRRIYETLRKHFVPLKYAVNLIKGNPVFEQNMQMNIYSINRVTAILQENGIKDVYMKAHGDTHSHKSVFMFFQKKAG